MDMLAELNLQPMTASVVDQVMSIEETIYPFPWTKGNFTDSIQAGYDAWVLAPQDWTPGMPLIGYAVLMTVLDEVHLLNLSVSGAHQRQGIGRRLLGRLMTMNRKTGARGMFLEVRPSNQPAIALYESEGFVRIGIRRNYYPSFDGKREDAIVMRCWLDRT